MNENILLINVHSSCNAGDAALTAVTLEQLSLHFPGSRITLAMDDPASHSGEERAIGSFFTWIWRPGEDGRPRWLKGSLLWLLPGTLLPALSARWLGRPVFALTPKAWRPLVAAYLQADLFVSKPGGFLYSSGRSITLIVSLYTLALGLLLNKPVYMFPQSIGPLRYAWERRLARLVLERLRLVMVREEMSLQELRQCGLPLDRTILLPDMAFAFQGGDPAAGQEWLRSLGIPAGEGIPMLGMTAINWAAQNPSFTLQERYEAACAAAARWFVEETGGQVVLFPQVWGPLPSQDDRVAARRIATAIADMGSQVHLIETPVEPALLKAGYAWMDVFIGTRMHSNIFALSQGRPVVAIGYQHKTQGIARMVGIEPWAVEIRSIEPDQLTQQLSALWDQRQSVAALIRSAVPQLAADASAPGRLAAQDFDRWRSAQQRQR